LPEWFIKLFTQEGDWVMDPFTGSGTTNKVAHKLGRNSIGIEIQDKYFELAKERVASKQLQLLEVKEKYEGNKSRGR